jgi:hypothetical protein
VSATRVLKKFYLVECNVFEFRKFPPNKIETSLLSIRKKCDEENSDEENPCSRNVIFPLEFPRNKIGNSVSSLKGAKKKF